MISKSVAEHYYQNLKSLLPIDYEYLWRALPMPDMKAICIDFLVDVLDDISVSNKFRFVSKNQLREYIMDSDSHIDLLDPRDTFLVRLY